jgi:hypothetical protein
MYLLQMAIHSPERLRNRKHKGLLTHMLPAIACRALLQGTTVAIYKVRAHIGVAGNDRADEAAKEAAASTDGDNDTAAYADALSGDPGLGSTWPLVIAQLPAEGEDPEYWLADNLKGPLKRQLERVHQNRIIHRSKSAMLRLLLQQNDLPHGSAERPRGPSLLRESALAIWSPKFTKAQLRLALLLRFDQYVFGKHRNRMYPDEYPSAECVLCMAGAAECQAHALAECMHAHTHSMVCARHGHGLHLIATALREAFVVPVIAAAEGHEAFQQPAWLLRCGRASTPDILTVPGLLTAQAADKRRHMVLLPEYYHTHDTNLGTRWHTKRHQHSALAAQLRAAGWQGVTEAAVGMGHSGLITGNLMTLLTGELRMPKQTAQPVVVALAQHAVQACADILCMRRDAIWAHTTAVDPPLGPAPSGR